MFSKVIRECFQDQKGLIKMVWADPLTAHMLLQNLSWLVKEFSWKHPAKLELQYVR